MAARRAEPAALPAGPTGRRVLGPSAALLTLAVLLGGGGSPAPLAETGLLLCTLLILALAVARGVEPIALLRCDRRWGLLLVAVLALPLLQLIPLPVALWTQLPGRGVATAALAAAGDRDAAMPWAMLPDGAVAAALALLPALAMALLAAALPPPLRVRLVLVLAALAGVAALLGLVQFIRGPEHQLSGYADVHRGWGIGFFANRNAQGDLLAVGLVAAVLLIDRHRARLASVPARVGAALAVLLLLAAAVASGSRMGMAVTAVPVLLALGLAGRRAPVLAGVLAVGAAVLLVGGTALDRVTARAGDAGNRTEIWGDSLFVARMVAPSGAGMGSFQPLYTAAERLDHVQPTIANRAHNDWLELAIEGGVPALALLALLLGFVAVRTRRGWRDPDPDRRLLARFAGLTALIFAAHSVVDYPLRTLTLLTVAGLAAGGLAFGPGHLHDAGRREGPRT